MLHKYSSILFWASPCFMKWEPFLYSINMERLLFFSWNASFSIYYHCIFSIVFYSVSSPYIIFVPFSFYPPHPPISLVVVLLYFIFHFSRHDCSAFCSISTYIMQAKYVYCKRTLHFFLSHLSTISQLYMFQFSLSFDCAQSFYLKTKNKKKIRWMRTWSLFYEGFFFVSRKIFSHSYI